MQKSIDGDGDSDSDGNNDGDVGITKSIVMVKRDTDC